jgi:hypothetical protein
MMDIWGTRIENRNGLTDAEIEELAMTYWNPYAIQAARNRLRRGGEGPLVPFSALARMGRTVRVDADGPGWGAVCDTARETVEAAAAGCGTALARHREAARWAGYILGVEPWPGA